MIESIRAARLANVRGSVATVPGYPTIDWDEVVDMLSRGLWALTDEEREEFRDLLSSITKDQQRMGWVYVDLDSECVYLELPHTWDGYEATVIDKANRRYLETESDLPLVELDGSLSSAYALDLGALVDMSAEGDANTETIRSAAQIIDDLIDHMILDEATEYAHEVEDEVILTDLPDCLDELELTVDSIGEFWYWAEAQGMLFRNFEPGPALYVREDDLTAAVSAYSAR